ncbi:unnamed protein product [Mycena citricolor]|uniref:Uncharacterized protein n=1 Tax=Mycena citricolor TaxID=2018698 RepID=A0AAD2JWA2_9AGAR|nr:unnamed protein product [Mycena citricolor]
MLVGRGSSSLDVYNLKLEFLQITAEGASYGALQSCFPRACTLNHLHIHHTGIFLAVAIMSANSLISHSPEPGSGSLARKILLGITLFMLLGTTTHLGLHLGCVILGLGYGSQMKLAHLSIGQTVIRRIVYFISDAVVVWRAWVLSSPSLPVRWVLALLLAATLATSMTLLAFNIISLETGRVYPTLEQNMLGTFCLLLTNACATGVVGWKLWYYRRNLKQYLNRGSRRGTVEGVLVLLLESGAGYCIFWLLTMVDDFGYMGGFGFEWFQPGVSATYPTLIILLVSQRKMLTKEAFSYAGPTLDMQSIVNDHEPEGAVSPHKDLTRSSSTVNGLLS